MGKEIYELKDSYYDLDEEGKMLVNEIIRFCNENNKFPKEKELTKKNGYIPRTRFYKYFNSTSFAVVYNYISPRSIEMPKFYKCNCCGVEKEFDRSNFPHQKHAMFGLNKICIKCHSDKSVIRSYNKKGINIKNISDLTIYEWYNLVVDGVIQYMPKELYTDENRIKIIRKLLLNNIEELNKKTIIEGFSLGFREKYKLKDWVYILGNKVECLNKCFPEYNFSENDFEKYTDNTCYEILERNFKIQNVTPLDVINGKFNMRATNELKSLNSSLLNRGIGTNDMYIKYFEYKNIKHPKTNKDITLYDFSNKPCGFYDNKDNVREVIRNYCENICEESIIKVINNTSNLINWVGKYFNQRNLSKIITYSDHYSNIYECLIDVYPIIKNENVLFEWEWTQCNIVESDYLVNALREFVLYRIPNIKNYENDIPKYMNSSYLSINCPKLVKHVTRNRFDNFYEWAILSFPEYKDSWTKDSFNIIESFDGFIFDSYQEKDVYEYMKNKEVFKYIKSVGRNKSGKYVFKSDDINYKTYCPDFIIEYVYLDGSKIKLNKPIIIEYYGMYTNKPTNEMLIRYRDKTLAKEKYYKSNEDIYYIGIYPRDIKNNFKGLAKKLDLFILGKHFSSVKVLQNSNIYHIMLL